MSPFDIIDGKRVPQTIIAADRTIRDHTGSIRVEAGTLTLLGTHNGSLQVLDGASALIVGAQNGSVAVGADANVDVKGSICGSTTIKAGATVIIHAGAKLAGSLSNDGLVIVRGVFGGSQSGDGELRLEGDGYVKEPEIIDGAHVYRW